MQISEIPVIEGLTWFNLETRLKNYVLWVGKAGEMFWSGTVKVGVGRMTNGKYEQGIFLESIYHEYTREIFNYPHHEIHKFTDERPDIYNPANLLAKIGRGIPQIYPRVIPESEMQFLRRVILAPDVVIQTVRADLEIF